MVSAGAGHRSGAPACSIIRFEPKQNVRFSCGNRRANMTQNSRSTFALFLLSVVLATALRLQASDPLADQVSIYRDEYGVPHIVGETEEATFFGYGYAQAQDHLEKRSEEHTSELQSLRHL